MAAAATAAAASAPPLVIQKNSSSLREDLTCAICCDLFREPVMLACMHHFCKACISRYWRGAYGPVSCPQCRKEFSSKTFQTNYLVSAMVDKVRASTSESYVKNLQKQMKDTLESHRLKRDDFMSVIRRDRDKMDAIKRAGAELQLRVRGEFDALRTLLQEEEASVTEQLRRETEEALETLRRHLEASEEAVAELEENIRLLQRADIDDAAASESGGAALAELPQLRSCVRVGAAPEVDLQAFSSRYMAPLQYITWRRMFSSLKPGPAPLMFDVDTAHPSVYVSRDRTMAVESDSMISYKRNPKRFLQSVNLLAAQGFTSGRHYWEVGVGSKAKWDVGVASEDVDRQARVKLSPEAGYWTLRLRHGDEYWAGTQPWSRVQVSSAPQRVGVFLDCDERRVAFYNADDMSLLYAFVGGPRGKAFPFFSPCISDDAQRPQPLQLIHHPAVALSG